MEVFKDIAKMQEVAAALSGKNKEFYDSFTELGVKLKTLDEQWEGDDKQALMTQINGDYKVYAEFYDIVNKFVAHLNEVIEKTLGNEKNNIAIVNNRG
ncbi:hypothetical protein LSA36186_08040 [Lachnoanaerobaculum sp. JCM 36186]|jgi:hypothetical protein|uniref:hypothetical protein n=1 Tax=Lachnoanaerobaculum sanguinis TaxID=3065809 RepID=UPI0027780314|nr:hypothetical protein [Lachnoanaerobaculum sp. JCM 36186]GMO02555.1 hypothetical protein LSA36186_08040 [Lachnoanaerobaculum sp. JCM 36186]